MNTHGELYSKNNDSPVLYQTTDTNQFWYFYKEVMLYHTTDTNQF